MTTAIEAALRSLDWRIPQHADDTTISLMTTPQYAARQVDIADLLEGRVSRHDGLLFVASPALTEATMEQAKTQALADREASAQRAMTAAGLTAPARTSDQVPRGALGQKQTVPTRPKPRRRGPINRDDFIPLSQKRRIRRQAAHLRGDYLYTDAAGDAEESGFKAKPRVKFRPATAAPFKVSIGPRAWRDITRLVVVAAGDYETGGSLLGHVTEGMLRVSHALPPGKDAEMTRTSVKTRQDPDEIARIIAEVPGRIELGAYHSHPWGLGEPSEIDRAGLVADHEIMGIATPIQVIVRPDLTYGWARPIPACWALVDSDDPSSFRYDIVSVDVAI